MSSVKIPKYFNLNDNLIEGSLRDIGAIKVYGGIRKNYIDKRYKTTVLKSKHHDGFKRAYGKRVFDSKFFSRSKTISNGRKYITNKIRGNASVSDFKKLVNDRFVYDNQNNKKYQFKMRVKTENNGVETSFIHSTSIFDNINDGIDGLDNLLEQLEERYEDVDYEELSVLEVIQPSAELIGRGGKSLVIANKTWYEPKLEGAIINCLYQAYCVADDPTLMDYDDNKKLVKSATKLKNRVKGNKNYSTMEDVEMLAKHCKRTIKVYSNIYQKIWEFSYIPKSKNTKKRTDIELRIANEHFTPLIRWGDLHYSDEKKESLKQDKLNNEILGEKIVNTHDESSLIDTSKMFRGLAKSRNTKLMAYDLECSPVLNDNNRFKTYAVGCGWYNENGDEEYAEFWGCDEKGCIVNWMDWLYENRVRFSGYYLYAHNGGRFDFQMIMKECLIKYSEKWCLCTNSGTGGGAPIELNGSWISATIKTKDGKRLHFRDSLKLLPATLDKLCKELKVKYQKLPETVNHNDISDFMNANDFDVGKLINTYPNIKTYLKHDVLGLLEIIDKMSQTIEEISYQPPRKYKSKTGEEKLFKGGCLDMTKMLTGATLSKKMFFWKYYNKNKYPVYSNSKQQDKFVRESYLGGRTECLYKVGDINEHKKFYYYDFTSLYPNEAFRNELPYGEPYNIKNWSLEGKNPNELNDTEQWLFDEFYGFVEVLVKTVKKDALPLHGIKHNNSLKFPIFENWTKLTLFSEELKEGVKRGIYEYRIVKGMEYERGKFLSRFMGDAFERKKEATVNDNEALAYVWKIIANSGYGFWGLRTEDREGTLIYEKGDISSLSTLPTIVNECDVGEYIIQTVKQELNVSDFNVSIASAISSYARIRLYNLLTSIKEAGGEIFYCDTDSVICSIDILNDKTVLNTGKTLQETFMWDKCGEELGSLKNECNDYVNKMVKKGKIRNEDATSLINKENGSLYFDELITYAPKFYSLQKKLENNKNVEITKCKGYKGNSKFKEELTHELLKNTTKTDPVMNHQIQFVSPRSGFVDENNLWNISIVERLKKFNVKYLKGDVDENGFISPVKI